MGSSYPKTVSWMESEDCCLWEGVVCDNSTGDVVGLDLSCARLRGAIDSNSSMFSLRHLRSLSLAGNNLRGVIPTEISHLSKLVSLNLSYNGMEMQNPTMRMLVTNITQLEELDLTSVDMSTVHVTSLVNFTSSLTSLIIAECSLGGIFPDYIFKLPNLQQLDLSSNSGLHGTLPQSNWSTILAFLSLSACSFTGEVPHSIGTLTRLTSLDLSQNNFTGHVDFRTFSTLKNLRSLGLSGLSVSGEDATDAKHKFPKLEKLVIWDGTLINFPCFFSSMPELTELYLSVSIVSEFPGQCVNNGLSFPLLQRLEMESCNLRKFPSSLSQSKKLRFLDLTGNMIEEIPSWFWGIGIDTLEELYLADNLLKGGLRLPWKSLSVLYLRSNSFEGPLPIPLAQFIRAFYVGQNRFNGSIPPSICQLTSLEYLELRQNNLTGVIPPCFGNLTDLRVLDLSNNSLMGTLPPLTSLDLSQNNFTGHVDFRTFSTLKNLRSLGLSGLSVSGEDATDAKHKFPKLEKLVIRYGTLINFPCFFSSMPELAELYLSGSIVSEFPGQCVNNGLSFPLLQRLKMESCKLTKFPSFLSQSKKLRSLELTGNMIEEIPSWFWGIGIDTLEVLDLSDNLLKGGLRLPWKSLSFIFLQNNSFEGPLRIPLAPSIRAFYVGQNRFNGSIPPSICQLTSLELLDLGQNNLTGVIPPCFGNLTDILTLDLSNNSLMGPLPLPSHATYYYSVSNNNFSGEISSLICNATNLVFLDLSSNGITGTLPQCLKNINTRLVYLNFRMNKFHGLIPEIFPKGCVLTSIDFSRNQFYGSLPRSLSNCRRLEALDVGSNKIVDSFPDWLGDLPLKVLSLRSNKLRGHLSVFQGTLDLTWNNLAGPIPSGGHFNTFSDSFEGNPGLCGIPLTRSCSQGRAEAQPLPDQRDNGKDELGGWFEWMFVAMGFGSGVGIGISLGYMALEMGRPLWLSRMVIRLEGSCRKRSKRKAPRRNSRT